MDALFQPGRIGKLTLKNRLVMPPMTTRLAEADGTVTQAQIAYYRARAAGGCGLITVEMASPERAGIHRRRETGIAEDRHIAGLRLLVAAIHDAGAKAAIQLGHGGGHTRADVCGETPIAPSAIPHPVFEGDLRTIVPQAMSLERIARTTAAFVAAAGRAREAGFDAIELHGAHGYLISQFLCPAENLRSDDYGGSLENRARFGLDILRAIKAGHPDLPVIFRFNGDDFFPGAFGFAEAMRLAPWLVEAGADALHVTAGHYRSRPSGAVMIPPMRFPEATFLDFAAAIKAGVSAPVIAVGRLGDPALAERAVAEGKADFVALGRPLVADPDWPAKVRDGRSVTRCLACNACIDGMRGGRGISCTVNPRAGRETTFLAPAQASGNRRIAVVGGGPAGLNFAVAAARAGHRVTLFEREAYLGGALRMAAEAPLFEETEAAPASFLRYIADLQAAGREAGVEFRFGIDVAATPEVLVPFPELVLATGARPRLGLGPVLRWLLQAGLARRQPLAGLLALKAVRQWFYGRGRAASGPALASLARGDQRVTLIGDAREPGRARAAIADALGAAAGLD
ncbi:MAG: FAD-dependent oxidoreductase [Alphaproteobacteria bacterium]|nr:FAD-dependent oxidoreductase [Alphaproteobacteria bacterium]